MPYTARAVKYTEWQRVSVNSSSWSTATRRITQAYAITQITITELGHFSIPNLLVGRDQIDASRLEYWPGLSRTGLAGALINTRAVEVKAVHYLPYRPSPPRWVYSFLCSILIGREACVDMFEIVATEEVA